MRTPFVMSMILLAAMASGSVAQSPEFRHVQGGVFEGASFLDSNNGWVCGDGGRVHWTTDGGQNWTEAVMPPTLESQVPLRGMFFIEVEDDVIGWVVGDRGVVMRTVDNTDGKVWQDLNEMSRITNTVGGGSPCTPIGQLAELYDIFMIDEDEGWAVGVDGVLVYTTDGGETWTDASDSLPISVCEDDPRDLYDIHFFYDSGAGAHYSKGVVTSEYGDIFITDNAGTTWTEVDIRTVLSTEECPLSGHNLEFWRVAFSDPQDADSEWWLAGGVDTSVGYIFKKSSGWTSGTWSQSNCYNLEDPQQVEDAELCSVPTLYTLATLGSSDPVAFTSGYAGGVFILETGTANFDPCTCLDDQDSGWSNPWGTSVPTWVEKSTEIPLISNFSERTPFFAAARISSTKACTVGSFGRIAIYQESADPEVPEVFDVANTAFTRIAGGDFIDSDTGCVTGQAYLIWRTDDGGETWTNVSGSWSYSGGEQGNALAFSSSGQYGAVVGTGGFTAYSDDYGETWTQGNDTGEDLFAVCFAPDDESIAYAVGESGSVRKSTNYGAYWRQKASPGSEYLFGVSFSSADDGYAVGGNKKAYRTTSGGDSWAAVTVNGGVQATLRSVTTWAGGGVAVAVGDNGTVFEKTGTTFDLVTDSGFQALGVTEELLDVQVLLNGSDVDLRIGGNAGVVLFRDAGTWSHPKSHTNSPVHQVWFESSDQGFALGQNFVILEYTDA